MPRKASSVTAPRAANTRVVTASFAQVNLACAGGGVSSSISAGP
jgi:hypothetical protein